MLSKNDGITTRLQQIILHYAKLYIIVQSNKYRHLLSIQHIKYVQT